MMARPGDNSQSDQNAHWICVGVISGPHGVKGLARITSFTEVREGIKAYDPLYLGPDYAQVDIDWGGVHKSGFLARIKGLETREDVVASKGRKLYVRREQLPESDPDEYYFVDLAGLEAFEPSGAKLGIVKSVHDFGGGPVLDLVLDQSRPTVGRTPLVPFKVRWVPEVDIPAGRLVVDLDAWLGAQDVVQPDEGQSQVDKPSGDEV